MELKSSVEKKSRFCFQCLIYHHSCNQNMFLINSSKIWANCIIFKDNSAFQSKRGYFVFELLRNYTEHLNDIFQIYSSNVYRL